MYTDEEIDNEDMIRQRERVGQIYSHTARLTVVIQRSAAHRPKHKITKVAPRLLQN